MSQGRILYCKLGEKLVYRANVPADKKLWHIPWPDYSPTTCTLDMSGKPWADPEIGSPGFTPKFNELDGKIDRRSHTGRYDLKDGCPLNPHGRTGVIGRGRLGRWGPNHAADPVVSRWKRSSSGEVTKIEGQPVLEFVAIKRHDNGQWAIPGGMVDPGEVISTTLRREFLEEALNGLELSSEEREEKNKNLSEFFQERGVEIFRGLVSDDPRNTDNAWMETVVVNYHDEEGNSLGELDLQAGDDASDVAWKEVVKGMNLYANHAQFLESVAKKREAYW